MYLLIIAHGTLFELSIPGEIMCRDEDSFKRELSPVATANITLLLSYPIVLHLHKKTVLALPDRYITKYDG